MQITDLNPKINGNSTIHEMHLFVPGMGTFWPNRETAIRKGTSPNGVGIWIEEYQFDGLNWFQAGNTNCWD